MCALFLCLCCSDLFAFVYCISVIFSLLYDHQVQGFEPRKKTHFIGDVSPHGGVQTFCGVVGLVDVAKHRESLWPNSFHPKLFDVEVMESQHMTTVCPFQHLAFDSVFDAAELR